MALLVVGASVRLVEPGEALVVYRLGAVDRVGGAGLSLVLPWPLERAERTRVGEIRRVEIGRQRLLTGDTNLVVVDLVAQYSVADPVRFALRHVEPDRLVARELAAAAAASVARIDVDTLLSTGRATLGQAAQEHAQAALDAVEAGVRLQAVEVRDVAPPEAVVNAFNDVSSARGDQETTQFAAAAYASRAIPEARGRAAEAAERARAHASERASRASADIARFEALRPAWQQDRRAVEGRLRGELLAVVGKRARVMAVPPGTDLILPEAP
ncbi:MAG: hypothetical protein FJ090_16660 [Deltaproteobacteria bacterium]|nr:hypothetical protein [Deltaproteobacteria bacterium]